MVPARAIALLQILAMALKAREWGVGKMEMIIYINMMNTFPI